MTGGEQGKDLAPNLRDGLDWTDGDVPVSQRFDDPYFSASGGLAEKNHVFLEGNALPARLRPGFQIAELGFGTGLNLLATLLACPSDLPIHYTSFEAYPMSASDIARALAAFPAAFAKAQPLLQALSAGKKSFDLGPVHVQLILGDARETLSTCPVLADAWFLDGFSPAKNPELWSEALMLQVAAHTAPSGTFATYTAAGHVRRALAAAGFEVTRRQGFGHKRHMTTGQLR